MQIGVKHRGKPFGKGGFIVGIDLRIVAATRHRDVCQAAIEK